MIVMRGERPGLALVAEVAEVLSRHGELHCAPEVQEEDGLVTLAVTFHPGDSVERALETLEVMNELQYIADVAQMRALCERHGIAPEHLEALLEARRASA